MKKKVLIITYYWPPSGGSGVQRWLKFVKYLPEAGVHPYIFTPANPSFAIKDRSLQANVPPEATVIRYPIWEPYDLFQRLAGIFGTRKTAQGPFVPGKNRSAFQKITTWIRGNLFIPDPRRFWVRPSVKFLKKYLAENSIHTIVTTGPPHSMHLIGYQLKQGNPSLRWLADFRDPWSEWGFLESIMAGTRARKLHRKMEAKVLSAADEIITITPFYKRRFEQLSGRSVTLLNNGFDEDDFDNLVIRRTDKFTVLHAGIVNERCDPRPFMKAIRALIEEEPSFRESVILEFVGDVHPSFRAFVDADAELTRVTRFTPHLPHKELVARYGEAALLLLVLTGYKDAEGYMPGKLYEYLATGLPVLAVGPEHGDASKLLRDTRSGAMIDGANTQAIKSFLLERFKWWKQGGVSSTPDIGVQAYSRRAITRLLADFL
ncbi:MAG TPA: glycosyl transferase [Ohtaekwangia sp.]|nr:glycosyl transferase [Ohtaekwangia sp.]